MAVPLEEYTRLTFSLYALPCPPLPQLALKGEDGSTETVSSHDMLMAGMTASLRLPESVRREHASKKMAALEQFVRDVEEVHSGDGQQAEKAARVYEVMCRYTRTLLGIYSDKEDVDARFAPLESVYDRDLVHRTAAQHLSIHHGLCQSGELPLRETLNLSYPAMLLRYVEYLLEPDYE